jgi:two-component system phosphate regulon sensor histidine kinase PhoR
LLGSLEEPQLILRMAFPLSDVERILARVRNLILGALLLGVLLAVGTAYLVSRGISRPVKELTRTAQRISSGDLSQRFRRYPTHEIGELGRAFDAMADHLQQEIQAVTEARDRMETILRGMVEGVMLTDRDGRILMINRALRDLLGLEVEPYGRTPSELLRNADLQEAVQRVLDGQAHVSLEIRTLGPSQKVLEVHLARLTGEASHGGAVAVFHDITERERLEKIRRDFVANVSHELRTPLTAIRGSIETILDGAIDNVQYARHFAEVIERHTTRLQRLLDDLLDLAKIESGEAAPRKEEIQATEFADAVLGTVAGLAESKGVEILRDLPRETLRFRGDRRQLEQAVVNLLDNAVKYTDPGGQITLCIRHGENENHLIVSDTGVGIPQEHLPRIFERFYRVDRARSRELGGTGLGLAIVKHITQAHGGRVEVDSFPGQGSTFRIILPS